MPAAVAIPIITAAATSGAAIAGAKMSSNATKRSAQLQTDAANRAAELQKQTSDETIAFEKQKEADDLARQEVDRQANYGQYKARYAAAQNLGHAFGFDFADAPDYVPSTPGTGGPARAAGAPSGDIPKSTGDVNKDLALANQITGSNHTDPNYWINAGYAKDPQYFFQKMLGMDAGPQDAAKQGPYAGGASRAAAPQGNTLASVLMPQQTPMGPARPVGPRTNTIRDYLATRI